MLLELCNSPGKTILIKLEGQVEDCCMSPQPPYSNRLRTFSAQALAKSRILFESVLHLISIADRWDLHTFIILLACRFVLPMPKFGEKNRNICCEDVIELARESQAASPSHALVCIARKQLLHVWLVLPIQLLAVSGELCILSAMIFMRSTQNTLQCILGAQTDAQNVCLASQNPNAVEEPLNMLFRRRPKPLKILISCGFLVSPIVMAFL